MLNYKKVFPKELYEYFYSNILTNDITKKEYDFLKNVLDCSKKNKICDIACGYGRHLKLFLNDGYDILGFDGNISFVDNSKKIYFNDYQKNNPDYSFDKGYCLHTSFGYNSVDEDKIIFSNFVKKLNKGGLFLLDLPNKNLLYSCNKTLCLGENKMVDNIILNKNKLIVDRKYFYNGEIFDGSYVLNLFSLGEMINLGKSNNLKVKSIFGDFNIDDVFSEKTSKRMIILYEKVF